MNSCGEGRVPRGFPFRRSPGFDRFHVDRADDRPVHGASAAGVAIGARHGWTQRSSLAHSRGQRASARRRGLRHLETHGRHDGPPAPEAGTRRRAVLVDLHSWRSVRRGVHAKRRGVEHTRLRTRAAGADRHRPHHDRGAFGAAVGAHGRCGTGELQARHDRVAARSRGRPRHREFARAAPDTTSSVRGT
jgi:hypothetical protein